jgi:NAD(P)-dependent dehydrogenase (short-subunit alcohol dehydrogenase family)
LLGVTIDRAGAHSREHVRFNAVLPGIIATPRAQAVAARKGDEPANNEVEANLLGRREDAWDIAQAVPFMCSGEAGYITGVTLPVNGGAVAAMPSSYLLCFGSEF